MAQINSPENYVMPFGKYRQMRAIDVSEIYQVDKDGNDKPVGLMYLQWLVKQDWFKHKEIIQQIIETAEQYISDPEETKPEEEKKPKKEKKDPKQKEKPKKTKEQPLKNIAEGRTVDFD